jgi:phytoene synthase
LIVPKAIDLPSCLELLKDGDLERYYMCLFSPEEHRHSLAALYAFHYEISRTRDIVSEPMIGEIRLQWWREALTGERKAEAMAHPVAEPLLAAIKRYRLPVSSLINLIDARVFDLYDDPMPGITDLEAYCGETSSALYRLASLILADGREIGPADSAGHAGVAQGITNLLIAMPRHAARGQLYLPGDLLARHLYSAEEYRARRNNEALAKVLADLRKIARDHLVAARRWLAECPDYLKPAFLSLTSIEPLLGAMEKGNYLPFETRLEPSRLGVLYRFWRAAKVGRI